jgi:hypothetical protein
MKKIIRAFKLYNLFIAHLKETSEITIKTFDTEKVSKIFKLHNAFIDYLKEVSAQETERICKQLISEKCTYYTKGVIKFELAHINEMSPNYRQEELNGETFGIKETTSYFPGGGHLMGFYSLREFFKFYPLKQLNEIN